MAFAKKKQTARVGASENAQRKPRKISKHTEDAEFLRSLTKTEKRPDVIAKIEKYVRETPAAPAFLQRIHRASEKNGTHRMSLRDINREIKKARKELLLKHR